MMRKHFFVEDILNKQNEIVCAGFVLLVDGSAKYRLGNITYVILKQIVWFFETKEKILVLFKYFDLKSIN
ncbi:hypothetical protein BpHYR1_018911 [Brachionus plicatilis]|uniref:Uncharacterized protein n=1 Tax=Brachionus plicatilis TaxID=10195 RepID=A0A3M7R0X3_BRAPC|nr:hypothetical protein BpHYR1_018911 [Brachionus plicatilis]